MSRVLLTSLVLPATLWGQSEPRVNRSTVTFAPPAARFTVATPPGPNPLGFRALVQGNKVTLFWRPAVNISWYLVNGPELGVNGQEIQDTTYVVGPLAPGAYEWTVASLSGQGQAPLTNWKQWPKAQAVIE